VTDRRLLEIAQEEFPLTLRPWASIASKLKITEEEALERLIRLCRSRIVRKVGPVLDPRRVGLRASTLIAMKVSEDRIRKVAQFVSKYEEVSHCHQREHEYNFWFTVAAHDEIELEKVLEEIRSGAQIVEENMLDLRPTEIYKIDVRFKPDPSM
jgi:DNA-binding Lrp family transcriptional regulator